MNRNIMGKLQEAYFECKCGTCIVEMQNPYRLVYPVCLNCGADMMYMRGVSTGGRWPTHNFDDPILMYSVGLTPGEEVAFKAANREIDLTPDGVPIARNRREKLQVLKYFGFEEK